MFLREGRDGDTIESYMQYYCMQIIHRKSNKMEIRFYNNNKTFLNDLTIKDVVIIISISIIVWLIAASTLGFLAGGFNCNYAYEGGDDFTLFAVVKELLEEKWCWNTLRLGAPFSQNNLSWSVNCLQFPEFLMLKIWGLFSKNPAVVLNLQYTFTFVLCFVNAYIVLRKIHISFFFRFLAQYYLLSLRQFT